MTGIEQSRSRTTVKLDLYVQMCTQTKESVAITGLTMFLLSSGKLRQKFGIGIFQQSLLPFFPIRK
jgi:hypothetical protein